MGIIAIRAPGLFVMEIATFEDGRGIADACVSTAEAWVLKQFVSAVRSCCAFDFVANRFCVIASY